MTQHDRLCYGLEIMGAIKLPRRNRYTMYKLGVHYYFVGAAGALRIASRQNAAASTPCNDRFRQKVFAAPASELAEVGL